MPNVFGARTGIALVALGLLIAANALIGPLALGVVRFHVSQTAENQLIGGEVVSLVVAAPLAVIAGVLWRRSNRLAPSLALGAALYALYMYVQYVVGPQYERYVGNNEYFFPLHLVLLILAWATGLRAWHALSEMRMPTIAIGTAMIFVAPAATMYAPEAPVPRTKAITGFFFAIFDTALKRYSDGPAAPPGESISITSARILLFSSIARSMRMNSVVRAGEPIAPNSSVTAMRSGLRLRTRASIGSPSVR